MGTAYFSYKQAASIINIFLYFRHFKTFNFFSYFYKECWSFLATLCLPAHLLPQPLNKASKMSHTSKKLKTFLKLCRLGNGLETQVQKQKIWEKNNNYQYCRSILTLLG